MNSNEWFEELSKNDDEAKKIIGFIVLWMAFDDKVTKWSEEKNDTIKGFDKLGQIKSFFTNNFKDSYNSKKDKFIQWFSQISGGERKDDKRVALQTGMKTFYYRKNTADSSSDAYAEVLYALRNNFFHGSKESNESNKKLICWAFDTLSELLHTNYGDEFLYFKD